MFSQTIHTQQTRINLTLFNLIKWTIDVLHFSTLIIKSWFSFIVLMNSDTFEHRNTMDFQNNLFRLQSSCGIVRFYEMRVNVVVVVVTEIVGWRSVFSSVCFCVERFSTSENSEMNGSSLFQFLVLTSHSTLSLSLSLSVCLI